MLNERTTPEVWPAGQRIALINPTRYLGNLLLAGHLIQDFLTHCQAGNKELLIVLDESFRELLAGTLPEENLLFYPRQRINAPFIWKKPWQRYKSYWTCLRQLRAFRADLAFNLEEDSVAHHLTRFSGAGFKLGCSQLRHKRGYDSVLPISFTRRPVGREHRWFSYQEIFAHLGLPETRPAYLRFPARRVNSALPGKLSALDIPTDRVLIALHAGATKVYKQWPAENFVWLARRLQEAGLFPVFIGAGRADREINRAIMAELSSSASGPVAADLCDKLDLAELADFLGGVGALVGNDSGPSHLAAALDTPVIVLFGPTDPALWRPLSASGTVMRGSEACAAACTRRDCAYDYRCLKSIEAGRVLEKIMEIQIVKRYL
ncbi:MAG: glycosyltransferase family 9 protein [Pseudomonadales bacterium]|nr:glycosyltransferase family 9 protein [Pseudomonadales bacterium]